MKRYINYMVSMPLQNGSERRIEEDVTTIRNAYFRPCRKNRRHKRRTTGTTESYFTEIGT